MSENNLHHDDDLHPKAPFLLGLKKEEPFEAPNGYFEKFQAELSNKIHSKKPSIWSILLKPVIWAPALVILMGLSIFLFKGDDAIDKKNTATNIENLKLNEISFEVLDAYVNDHVLAQVNTDEIMEWVGIDNIPLLGNSDLTKNKKEITPTIEHIEEEEMEEYIMENMDEMEVY